MNEDQIELEVPFENLKNLPEYSWLVSFKSFTVNKLEMTLFSMLKVFSFCFKQYNRLNVICI